MATTVTSPSSPATMDSIVSRTASLLGSRGFVWSAVAIGIAIRIVAFAANRSLWGDEGALALNIIGRSFSDLLRPLDFLQGAPSGYLLGEKAITDLFGEGEAALRLLALIGGIAALILFAITARRLLAAPAAGIAILLFAVSEQLVYYSSEVKQYSTDTAVAVGLLLAATLIDWKRASMARLGIVIVAGCLLVWMSHTALIVVPSLLLALLIARRLEGDTVAFRRILGSALVIGVSALFAYAVSRRNTSAVGEAALGPGGGGDGFLSPVSDVWNAFADPVGVAYSTTGLALLAALLGIYVLARARTETILLILLPIAATLLAAVLGLYPFAGRFVLFLVPFALLLIGTGVWALASKGVGGSALLGLICAILVVGYPVARAASLAISPPGHEEVRTVLRHVQSNWEPNDSLFVWFQTQYPFRYYAECDDCNVLDQRGPASTVWPPVPHDLANADALATHPPRLYLSGRPRKLSDYVRDFRPLQGKRRVWLLFSSGWNDQFARYALDCLGTRLDEARAMRAVAYLYDFSKAPETSRNVCAAATE